RGRARADQRLQSSRSTRKQNAEAEPGAEHPEPRTRNPERGTLNAEPGTELGLGTLSSDNFVSLQKSHDILVDIASCVTSSVHDRRGPARPRSDTVVVRTKVKSEHGEEKESRTRSEASGDLSGLPLLGVKSVKMLANACP